MIISINIVDYITSVYILGKKFLLRNIISSITIFSKV